jgi:glucose/arabinose dehydrogenase
VVAACAPVAKQSAPVPVTTQTTGAPVPPRAASLAGANVKLTQIVELDNAIAMATRPGDDSLYFGTQDGIVRRFRKGRFYIVLDIRSFVLFDGGERGFLGMTFNPAGDKLYVHYSRAGDGDTEVVEYAFAAGVANPLSKRIVFQQDQPQANHNGGSLLFSPADGYLYLALGDGGGFNDTGTGHAAGGNGQSQSTLLGKLIRIDPTDPTPGGPEVGAGDSYTIPPSNPFVGAGDPRDEIWSLGLRNPYRMSFDRLNGDLWIGDVGQGLREEIDYLTIGDLDHPGGRGANFGWNRREGDIDGPNADNTIDPSFTAPVLAPVHADVPGDPGDCAIIGGYVYHGARIPDLVGAYVYTDLCDARIRAFTPNGGSPPTDVRTLTGGVSQGVSFGEDDKGELYVLSLASGVWRIDPAVPPFSRS